MANPLVGSGYLVALIVIGLQGLLVGLVTAAALLLLHLKAKTEIKRPINRAILIFLATQLLYFPLALFLKFAVMGLMTGSKNTWLTRFLCGSECATTFDLDYKAELLVKTELRLYLFTLLIIWSVAIFKFIQRRRQVIRRDPNL